MTVTFAAETTKLVTHTGVVHAATWVYRAGELVPVPMCAQREQTELTVVADEVELTCDHCALAIAKASA